MLSLVAPTWRAGPPTSVTMDLNWLETDLGYANATENGVEQSLPVHVSDESCDIM